MIHPKDVLVAGEKVLPSLAMCEHYAGNQKFIQKAFDLQVSLGPIFDINCDCEDGAKPGHEREQAMMIAQELRSERNIYKRSGARIHGVNHPTWTQDVDILLSEAGEQIAFMSLPKARTTTDLATMIEYIQKKCAYYGLKRQIPLHAIIETPGALKHVARIAGLPWLEALAFGQLDFISEHHGAIPLNAMQSPAQFEHALIVRAKAEIVEAALTNALVPTHSLTLELTNTAKITEDASIARDKFGFLRMWSIHPTQITPIVDAMKPRYEDVHSAELILIEAQKADWAPIRYEGKLQEAATYRYFWELLKRAHSAGITLSDDTIKRFL